MGMERSEDAGIYKLTEELAIVQTVDFFTPIVDSPGDFGRIAVANALSDVYAKGGRPLTALNIVCFPQKAMPISILKEILAGGLEKMREAGVLLIGGHSVDDAELKYGLAVTGTIHPSRVVFNNGARAGDRLILTKPLGTGIISTAIKGNVASKKAVAGIVKSMSTLNRKASEVMLEVGVHACTDVTGFGFLGHAAGMVEGTEVGMVIEAASIPFFPEARGLAETGMMPGGLQRNRDFRRGMVDMGRKVPQYLQDILFDPQTSGGLLISVSARRASRLLKMLHEEGVAEAAVVGGVVAEPKGRIIVR
jgi:selenide,water dikinase